MLAMPKVRREREDLSIQKLLEDRPLNKKYFE
jgi:hypothetical protein